MRIRRKLLSLLLAAALTLGVLPGTVFAQEAEGPGDVSAAEAESVEDSVSAAEAEEPESGVSPAADAETPGTPQTWSCGEGDGAPTGGVTAVLDGAGTLTVSGSGPMHDFTNGNPKGDPNTPWRSCREQIRNVVIKDGVTSVSPKAFYNCPKVESVEIAGSVRTIGEWAFSCYITLKNSPLKRAVIHAGDGCEIGRGAFAYRDSLEEAVLGEGVRSIGEDAFAGCHKLQTIRFPETLVSVGDFSFSNCTALTELHFPDSLHTVGYGVFQNCTALTELILPKNVTSLGGNGFHNTGVTRVAVPAGLEVPDDALPKGVEKIVYTGETPANFDSIVETPGGSAGGNAGENPGGSAGGNTGENPGGSAGGNTSENPGGSTGGNASENPGGSTGGDTGETPGGAPPTPPAGIVSSGDCGKVSGTVTWTLDTNGLLTIRGTGEMKDYSSISRDPRPWGESNVKALVIEEGVTKVGGYAFHQHMALKSVQLPESLTAIGSNAFDGCVALPSVTIPQAVTSLGFNTFSGCKGLTEARVHRQLKQIPSNAFPATCKVTRYGIASGECGKTEGTVTWTLDGNGLLTIRGKGEMKDYTYYASSIPWDVASVKTVVIEEGVTSVGEYAFYQHTALESVRLPESLKNIGRSAFNYCAALTEITLPRSLESVKGKLLFYASGLIRARVFYRTEYSPSDFPENCAISLYGKTLTPGKPLRATRTVPAGSDNLHIGHWSRPDCSYLAAGDGGGFYRVDYYEETGLVMEEYGPGGAFYQGWDIPMELPVFGGFFSGSDGFYFVFGQENPQESDRVEVLRVVKYTKDLERLGEASLFGGNTYSPFHAAGCRMDEGNGLLYIHTGHQMYKSSDGYRHQACMTFSVDTEIMEFQYQFYGVANYTTNGYVSHSFDQYIRVDGNRVVRLDLGDAYPRGAGLFVNGPSLAGNPVYTVALPWSGSTGDNNTGSWLGGLEVSKSAYLTALSSVDQTSGNRHNNKTFNVYLLATDKETMETRTVQVTRYSEGGPLSVDAPQLVKFSDDRFLLLWEEQNRKDSPYGGYFSYSGYTGMVKYAFFDGAGNQLGGIQSMSGAMSDCQPEVIGGKAVWYVTEDGGKPVFYQIGSDGKASSFTPSSGQKPSGGSVTLPGNIKDALANGTAALAASYSGGRLTNAVLGTVKDGKAVFSRKIPAGWTLYFLDPVSWTPLCEPIIL